MWTSDSHTHTNEWLLPCSATLTCLLKFCVFSPAGGEQVTKPSAAVRAEAADFPAAAASDHASSATDDYAEATAAAQRWAAAAAAAALHSAAAASVDRAGAAVPAACPGGDLAAHLAVALAVMQCQPQPV